MNIVHGESWPAIPARERYAVAFSQPAFRLSRRRTLNFHGNGTVHFLQTGFVADGLMPQISLPFIDRVYHVVMAAPTSRTIPYAAVTHHAVLNQRLIRLAKVPMPMARRCVSPTTTEIDSRGT